MIRRGAWLLAVVVALALAAPIVSAPRRASATVDLPAWVREAAARTIAPAGRPDLVWLHDEWIVEPLAGGGVREIRRTAARALKPDALQVLATWRLFHGSEDRVVSADAWALLADGTARRADPKTDHADLPATDGFSVFADSRALVVRSPGAPVGSVLAFESEAIRGLDPGHDAFFFGDPERATAHARFAVRVPDGWSLEFESERVDDRAPEFVRLGSEISWVLHDLPPLPRLELPPPARDRMPVARVRWGDAASGRGYASWDDLARWLRNLAEPVLADAAPAQEIARSLRPATPEATRDALAEVFRHAAREVRYVSIQIGIGGYKPFSPAKTWELRYGDCKAKTFLVRAMVEPWGIATYPVLVRTRDLGPVARGFPSPAQFNHMIVAVALPEGIGTDLWATREVEGLGRLVFLDPTASDSAPWDLPTGDQGTLGLVVHPGGGALVELPRQPASASSTRRHLSAAIDETGGLVRASLTETWSGSAAASLRAWFKGQSESELRNRVERDAQARFPGAAIASHRVDGIEARIEPVVATTELGGGRLGKRIGDLLVVEPGSVGFGLVAVTLPPPPRTSTLDLGSAREEAVETVVEVPPGWTPESIPAAIAHDDERLAFEGSWSFADGRLVYRRTARLKIARVAPEAYPAFREAVGRLNAADRTAIVLVRGG